MEEIRLHRLASARKGAQQSRGSNRKVEVRGVPIRRICHCLDYAGRGQHQPLRLEHHWKSMDTSMAACYAERRLSARSESRPWCGVWYFLSSQARHAASHTTLVTHKPQPQSSASPARLRYAWLPQLRPLRLMCWSRCLAAYEHRCNGSTTEKQRDTTGSCHLEENQGA
ncbi:hypothetical protein EJ03DRAFT_66569 [Teratosphaeria nubilosa]|uniref:Uncharacterized protein n=1 Tax=Teratosphaeria nubilosa TaxID=161662 RepID=A0A6G1LBP9_9PEZI|nr:hypothetical protein EJ03DRAFT_66569 [Teratosphaeria nubilosa]